MSTKLQAKSRSKCKPTEHDFQIVVLHSEGRAGSWLFGYEYKVGECTVGICRCCGMVSEGYAYRPRQSADDD